MKAQTIRPFRVLTMITASRDKVLRERPWWTALIRVGFTGFYAEVWQTGWDKGGDRAEGGESLEAMGIVAYAEDNGCPWGAYWRSVSTASVTAPIVR